MDMAVAAAYVCVGEARGVYAVARLSRGRAVLAAVLAVSAPPPKRVVPCCLCVACLSVQYLH